VTNKGTGIVSGLQDGTLRLWDIPSQKQVQVFNGHTKSVAACGVLDDESTIVSASADSSLKIWSMKSGRCEAKLQGHDDWVNDFAVVPNSLNIVSASYDGTMRIWDIRTRKCFRTLGTAGKGRFWCCCVTPDGSSIVSISGSTFQLWNLDTGKGIANVCSDEVYSCDVSGDGLTIVTGMCSGEVKFWKTFLEKANSFN